MKINVVGTSGSGKSTVARQLAQTFAVPYIEMDLLFWRPAWQGTPDEEFLFKVAEAASAISAMQLIAIERLFLCLPRQICIDKYDPYHVNIFLFIDVAEK